MGWRDSAAILNSMIYADHNATSPLDPAAWEAMQPYFREAFHNPASPYTPARRAALAIDTARRQVAALLDAEAEQVVFTSGGTEANAMAIHVAQQWNPGRRHWVCSAVEHASILEPLARLEREGHRVTRVSVDAEGRLDWEMLASNLTAQTALVSLMAANNETGALFDIATAAALARERGIPFHTDAAQAAGRVPISFRAIGADLLTCCAHKLHGPKGAGALVVRAGGRARAPLLVGGGQEAGWRAGTENVPALVGFGCASDRARERLSDTIAHTRALRDSVERGVAALGVGARVIAGAAPRLPNTSLFLIPGIDTDVLLAQLDMAGACCSSGSACASGAAEPSHVLRAMGLGGQRAAALRVSWGRFNAAEDANRLVTLLADSIRDIQKRLRD